MKNVLLLCTGNSCRSVLAEAYMNAAGAGRWQAFSAGSTPTGTVHPRALATLKELGLIHTGYRSKSWDEFAGPAAPQMDQIVTVCDNAAGETCPVWPGHPATAHWPFPDPAKYQGSEEAVRVHFREVFSMIKKTSRRISC
ncbi:MAG: arsenate reductase ArsC, partial [Pseudomonadota bacterium]|nr:arsenate reductase ArsC [Pseudomonadota bacterium]